MKNVNPHKAVVQLAKSAIFFPLALASLSVCATPSVTSVTGELKNGGTLVITGTGFGTKEHAKPLVWWTADGGGSLSSLGRETAWANPGYSVPVGEQSTKVVAPGSKFSWADDLGDPSNYHPILGPISFNSNELFVWRKIDDDFPDSSWSTRVTVTNVTGNFSIGQKVTGEKSGATGVISQLGTDANTGNLILFFNNSDGSVSATPRTDFVYGETVKTSTATAIDAEGNATYPVGTTRSFNYKTIRLTTVDQSDLNDVFVNLHQENSSNYYVEVHGDGHVYPSSPYITEMQGQWKVNELYYKASDLGVRNGIFNYEVDNNLGYNRQWITRSSSDPEPFDYLSQGQLSNSAQPGSWVYYDSLYVDDSWNHVVLCSSSSWANCRKPEIQIPTAWAPNKVSVQVHLGGLKAISDVYLYVADSEGNVNPEGYKVCPSCPTPPSIEVK